MEAMPFQLEPRWRSRKKSKGEFDSMLANKTQFTGGLTLLATFIMIFPLLASAQPPPATPTVNSPLVPEFAIPGSSAFTLTLNGTNFDSTSTVYWNGSARQTTYEDCCQIFAQITVQDVSASGSAVVTVINNSQLYGPLVSNSQLFAIAAPLSGVTYAAPLSLQLPSAAGLVVLATADVNADGKPDLVFANSCNFDCSGSTASVALGNGDGTFGPPITFAIANPAFNAAPSGFAFGDFNHDGKLDLIVVNSYCPDGAGSCESNNGSISYLAGNGDGTFQPYVEFNSGYDPVSVAAADFNNDGNLDLVVASTGYPDIPSALYVFLGNGDGTFQAPLTMTPAPYGDRNGLGLIAGDFNHDNQQDVAISGGATYVLLGNGDGTFQPAIQSATVNGNNLASGDFNGDGVPDLAVSAPCGPLPGCGFNGAVWVLLGNGDGSFQAPVSYSVEAPGIAPNPIVLGDFNGDGNLDIVAGNECGTWNGSTCSGSQLSILAGNGDGTFQPQVQPQGMSSFIGFNYLAAADFNNDGRIDLATDGAASALDMASVLLTTSLQLSTKYLGFGNQAVGGQTGALSSTLTNLATIGDVNIANAKITGANPKDFILTQTCPGALTPAQRCPVSAVFSPTAAGPRTATVTITDSAVGSPHTIALSGTGIAGAIATLSTQSLTFSSQIVNTVSGTQTVTLTNTGSAALTISSIAASAEFLQKNACGASLAPGAQCTIPAAFKPRAGGLRSGSLTISDNAPGSPQTVALTGTGLFFELSAPSLAFGTQMVGTSAKPQTLTLTNLANIAGGLSAVRIVGANPASFSQTNTCGPTVAGDGSCTITVTFTPRKTGSLAASVQVEAGGVQLTAALSGTGQ
jgi:hypothetical protein